MGKQGPLPKLTEETLEKFVALVRVGNYGHVAAQAIGIRRQVFYVWLRRGAEDLLVGRNTIYARFNDAFYKACAEAQAGCVATIRGASKDSWQAAAWLLERKSPDEWGRRDRNRLEMSGPGGGPIESVSTNVNIDLERLSDEQLAQLEQILTVARGGENGEGETGAEAGDEFAGELC